MPDHPPPEDLDEIKAVTSDLSKQVHAEHSGFIRFVWLVATASVIAHPAMMAIDIFLQQENDIMPLPNPSFGRKERAELQMGPEIAGLLEPRGRRRRMRQHYPR